MDKRDYGLIILAVAICAVILVGEYATYGNIYRYDSSADASGNFSVYDSPSSTSITTRAMEAWSTTPR